MGKDERFFFVDRISEVNPLEIYFTGSILRKKTMQCSCGGEMKDHKVQRNLQIVAEFQSCEDCGRVHWFWTGPQIDRKEFSLPIPPVKKIGQ